MAEEAGLSVIRPHRRTHPGLAVIAAFVASLACSESDGSAKGTGVWGDPEGASATPRLDTGRGGDAGVAGTGSEGQACPTLTAEDCVAEAYAGEAIPLDIYVLFDQSGSMALETGDSTRIDEVRAAVATFLADPASAGIGVGIGYFGRNDILRTDASGNPDPEPTSCDPEDHASPAVPIGVLPGHSAAIMESLARITPKGETPTPAALEGACRYARTWQEQHPSHAVAILLVTDGEPKAPITADATGGACDPSLEEAISAAGACLAGPRSIETYVLGVGPSLENLNQIAAEGGTRRAYLAGDQAASVLEALNAIRGAATIPCEFRVPEPPAGESLDLESINVVYSDSACVHHTIPFVADRTNCGAEHGWHYDEAADPSKILLCEQTCGAIAAPGSQFHFTVGCKQVVR